MHLQQFLLVRLGDNLNKDSTSSSQSPFINDEGKPYDRTLYNQLAGYDFESGGSPVVEVNNGQSTLNINSWKTLQQNQHIYEFL